MIGTLPKRPSGSSAEAIFMQWVWDHIVLNSRQGEVAGSRVMRTTRGVFVVPSPVKGGAAISVTAYFFHQKADEYIVCRAFNNGVPGDKDINIALPFELRNSIKTEKIDNKVLTYSQWDNLAQTRFATDDATPANTETQAITPRYRGPDSAPVPAFNGSIIFAATCFSGVMAHELDPITQEEREVKVMLQDLNVGGRAYARTPD